MIKNAINFSLLNTIKNIITVKKIQSNDNKNTLLFTLKENNILSRQSILMFFHKETNLIAHKNTLKPLTEKDIKKYDRIPHYFPSDIIIKEKNLTLTISVPISRNQFTKIAKHKHHIASTVTQCIKNITQNINTLKFFTIKEINFSYTECQIIIEFQHNQHEQSIIIKQTIKNNKNIEKTLHHYYSHHDTLALLKKINHPHWKTWESINDFISKNNDELKRKILALPIFENQKQLYTTLFQKDPDPKTDLIVIQENQPEGTISLEHNEIIFNAYLTTKKQKQKYAYFYSINIKPSHFDTIKHWKTLRYFDIINEYTFIGIYIIDRNKFYTNTCKTLYDNNIHLITEANINLLDKDSYKNIEHTEIKFFAIRNDEPDYNVLIKSLKTKKINIKSHMPYRLSPLYSHL